MKYIIHRGITSTNIEENSYEAIKKAIRDKNTVGVEFDIRLTKDHKIVLSHDSLINLESIEQMNYLDIIKKKYLTTLDRVLSINTNKILLIDIKIKNNYKKFADTLIKYLYNYKRNIYLCSFNKKVINYLQKKTKYKVGYILFNYKNNNSDFIMVNYNNTSNHKLINIDNKEIFLWTINNNKELNKVINKFTNINKYYLIINKEK